MGDFPSSGFILKNYSTDSTLPSLTGFCGTRIHNAISSKTYFSYRAITLLTGTSRSRSFRILEQNIENIETKANV
jgi:hypothetical protein